MSLRKEFLTEAKRTFNTIKIKQELSQLSEEEKQSLNKIINYAITLLVKKEFREYLDDSNLSNISRDIKQFKGDITYLILKKLLIDKEDIKLNLYNFKYLDDVEITQIISLSEGENYLYDNPKECFNKICLTISTEKIIIFTFEGRDYLKGVVIDLKNNPTITTLSSFVCQAEKNIKNIISKKNYSKYRKVIKNLVHKCESKGLDISGIRSSIGIISMHMENHYFFLEIFTKLYFLKLNQIDVQEEELEQAKNDIKNVINNIKDGLIELETIRLMLNSFNSGVYVFDEDIDFIDEDHIVDYQKNNCRVK